MRIVASAVLALALAAGGAPRTAAAPPDSTVFLTFESGVLVGADWAERDGLRLHTRSVLMRSRILDATIDLRDDGTAAAASTVLQAAGSPPEKPIERSLGDGAVYWSDMIPSSIEQAVTRARILDRPVSRVPAASLFSATRGEIEVERIDSSDWVLRYHGKRYDVLTDDRGRLLTATLPEYGVVIERHSGFKPEGYPLWPPEAAPPDGAYRAEDVAIRAPLGHVLAGTLTTPRGRGRFPAVVLITGLSANNRDNGDPPWMPLRDLADALTRAGMAVLRVDDRGVGRSTGDRASSTTFDEAEDVRAEVAWLCNRPEIDRKRLGLVGYSEGGLIAPMVAAGDSTIAAIVTLEGPGVPGPELARYQIEAVVVRDSTVRAEDREAEIQRQLSDTLTVRERSFLSINPLRYARRVRCPALVIQGGADLHVPPRSAERLASAMRSGGNPDVTVRVFPGISHAMLPDPVGLSSGWVVLPGFLTAPVILETVARWTASRLHAQFVGPASAARR